MNVLNFSKDGPVKASDLDRVLSGVIEELGGRIATLNVKVAALEVDVKRLRRELEAERRLRLSMKR